MPPFLPIAALLGAAAVVTSATAPRPADVALLVNKADAIAITETVSASVTSPDPLVRATAARVAGVRNLSSLVGALREQLGRETDAAAAREEIRTIAWLGTAEDVEFAVTSSGKWPASIDDDLAGAIARRGGLDAITLYQSKLSSMQRIDRGRFFRLALWGRPALVTVTASRLLGAGDAPAWQALLEECLHSRLAVDPGVLQAGLANASEEIRTATAWYVARGYAEDPARIPAALHEQFTSPHEITSNREGFARELVARMMGKERKPDARWIAWLDSLEADAILGTEDAPALFSWFADEEFAARKQRCGVLPTKCAMPSERITVSTSLSRTPVPTGPAAAIPSRAIAAPDFNVPDVLPAGLTSQLLTCDDGWLGVATVSVSDRGSVQSVNLGSADARRCAKVLEALIRLSLPLNAEITSPHTSGNVLLVRAARQPLCLDEPVPSDTLTRDTLRPGGKVIAPMVSHRVEPNFPASARVRGSSPLMAITLSAVITREGCIRNIRVISETPNPEANAAAVAAISQWKFRPAMLDGQPVDTVFTLTVTFRRN